MTGTAPPLGALGAFAALLVAQRLAELVISARHERALRRRGAREHGRGHFPLLVLLHVLFPLALAVEVAFLGARPGPLLPLWLALWLGAQALRYAAIRALGVHWSVRILVVPGMERVRRGPYRWLAHPNYLAVAIEFVAAPLLFGAWRTAVAFGLANFVLLGVRIRAEERALASAARSRDLPPAPLDDTNRVSA